MSHVFCNRMDSIIDHFFICFLAFYGGTNKKGHSKKETHHHLTQEKCTNAHCALTCSMFPPEAPVHEGSVLTNNGHFEKNSMDSWAWLFWSLVENKLSYFHCTEFEEVQKSAQRISDRVTTYCLVSLRYAHVCPDNNRVFFSRTPFSPHKITHVRISPV